MTARKPDRERDNALSEAAALRVANDALRKENRQLTEMLREVTDENRALWAQLTRHGVTQLPHRGYAS